MLIEKYTVYPGDALRRQIPKLIMGGLIDSVAAPVLFRSADDKILFVGDKSARKLKLPDTLSDVHNRMSNPNFLQKRVQELGRFAFTDCGILPEIVYVGLIRHKPRERRIIVPVRVDLTDGSSSPWLSPSDEWQSVVTNNADHVWADRVSLEAMLEGDDNDMLTANTAAIVQYDLGGTTNVPFS